jgi:antitoxin VapB
MRTVSIFKNGNNRAIRLPAIWILRGERAGDRPGRGQHHPASRPADLGSFAQLEKADPDFMAEREDVVSDEGRFNL